MVVDHISPISRPYLAHVSPISPQVLEGMHVVIDPSRPAEGAPPTAHQPLSVARRPALSNVAEVERVHADGSCDVRYVCNCEAPR